MSPYTRRAQTVSTRYNQISLVRTLDEPDRCPETMLNRILWRAMKGPNTPYPEWAVQNVADDD